MKLRISLKKITPTGRVGQAKSEATNWDRGTVGENAIPRYVQCAPADRNGE